MTPDIEKVLTAFRGIGDRDASLATKHIHPTKYKQHNPEGADGIEGLPGICARRVCLH